jgi:coniferyl-aldehyde dehydrogenase
MENIETTDSKMNDVLEMQKDYFIKNGPPSLELRIDRLNRLKNLILNNKTEIIKSINDDLEIGQTMPLY